MWLGYQRIIKEGGEDQPRDANGRWVSAVSYGGDRYKVHGDTEGKTSVVGVRSSGARPTLWERMSGNPPTPHVGQVMSRAAAARAAGVATSTSTPTPVPRANPAPAPAPYRGPDNIAPEDRGVKAAFGTVDRNVIAEKLRQGLPSDVQARTAVYANGRDMSWKTTFSDNQGTTLGSATRDYNSQTNSVYHALFTLSTEMQGKGIASNYLRNSVALYKEGGVAKVDVHAALENGAYTWAKFGFVPEKSDWDYLRGNLDRRADSAARNISSRTPDAAEKMQQVESFKRILTDTKPKALWKVVDHPLGKQLVPGMSWHGSLDLKDKESMERFDKNTAKRDARSTTKKADLPVGQMDEATALLHDLEGPEAVAEAAEAARRNKAG